MMGVCIGFRIRHDWDRNGTFIAFQGHLDEVPEPNPFCSWHRSKRRMGLQLPTRTTTILLIEDDLATIRDVYPVLGREGYRVDHVLPGLSAIRKVLVDEPDLVILGIQKSAREWDFCRQLVTFLDRPLFLLLSSANELDRAKGLELGADDCMAKPVLTVEFVARVRALLRRGSSESSGRQRSFFVDGDLVVDLTQREVRLNGEPVALSAKQFCILACLVRYVEDVVSLETILLEVWGPNHKASGYNLKPHIHHLRQKLEPDPHRPRRIVTQRGEGYMLRRIATEG
jgi:DNA-binding response OmpR family regulator